VKYSITYVLETKNNRPNEVRIRMRVRWNEKLSQALIPYTVNPSKWSKETNRCIANTTHGKDKVSASEINREIQKYEDAVDDVFKQNNNPSLDEFKTSFNILIGKSKPINISVFDVFDDYITAQSEKKGWTKKNIQKNETIKNQLRDFNPEITFTNLEQEKTINDFIKFLNTKSARRNIKYPEKGLQNSTVERYVSMLKWFLTWAKKRDYYKGDQNKYKVELKGLDGKLNTLVFFNWTELLFLYNYKFGNKTFERVRDCICFCCFTSLRHSDLITLRRSDVKENHIVVFSEKTDEGLYIDLNDYSREILKKYENDIFPDDLALPVMSNQKMNDYIKEIGKLLEFNTPTRIVYYIGSTRYEDVVPRYELFSTHIGRRTFIVNALYLGIPSEVVMRWTGHEDYESMKPYIEIVDALKNKEMAKFNKKSPTL